MQPLPGYEPLLAIVDPSTRCIAARDVVGPIDHVRAVLSRAPSVDAEVVSWGRLTLDEIDALAVAGVIQLDPADLEAHPPEHALWSVYARVR